MEPTRTDSEVIPMQWYVPDYSRHDVHSNVVQGKAAELMATH